MTEREAEMLQVLKEVDAYFNYLLEILCHTERRQTIHNHIRDVIKKTEGAGFEPANLTVIQPD